MYMPGIVGVINDKNGKTLLRSMMYSVKHRDWYLMDSYAAETFAIGRVHLGTLNSEPQPIFNEDKSLGIFMDGEIYDYSEEKKNLESKGHKFVVGNDPEFCLHKFEESGEDFVKNLNGSFVIVIFDKESRQILIVNDRHGLRPFYYAQNGKKHLFASEIKAILQDKTFKKEINHSAVADFFAFDRILGYKTFFEGISVLPPASIVVLSKKKIEVKQYWDFRFKEEYSQAFTKEYYVEKLVYSFRKAVRRRMKGKHHFGVFLSGGLDSRSVVAEISKKHNPVYTFTYAIEKGDEAKIAERVAWKLGTKHTFLKLERNYLARFAEEGVYLTDGMCNCRHFYWISSILDRVKKDVDVVFHGLGMGWLACPYLSFADPIHRKIVKTQDKFLLDLMYRKLNTLVTDTMMPHFFSDNYYQKIKGAPRRSLKRALENVPAQHPINKQDCLFLRIAGRYQMGPVLLRSSLEDRIPGFDNDFVNVILEVPPELRLNHKIYYEFFASLAPNLAKISYQKTGVSPIAPVLVHKIGFLIKNGYKMFVRKLIDITRGRIALLDNIGYPSQDELIRKDEELRKFFQNILLDKKTLSRGYFNKEYITQMIEDHMSRKKDYGKQLCALLTFELWHRLFVD